MPSRRQMLMMMAATASVAPVTTACSRARPVRPARAKDRVTFLTGYATTAREEFVQIPKAEGIFDRAGLDVTIVPGQPATNVPTLLAGRAQFASVDFVSAARGHTAAKGAYRIIAAVQHSTLLSLTSLAGMGISQPADLTGKTLAIAPQAAAQTLFPTYARLAGLDPTHTTIINAEPGTIPGLLATGHVQAIGTYSCDVPTIRKAAGGRTPIVLPYARYIGDLYGSVIITTTRLTETHPDLVQRFATAITQGSRHAVDHPDQAGQDIHAAVAADNAQDAAETMSLMRPYVQDGHLDQARVMRGITLLESAGMVPPNTLTPDQLVRFDLGPQA